jgi:hypothetical protein
LITLSEEHPMAESAKGKPTSSRPAARDAGRAENTIAPLQVRYYRRMSPRRVYGVSVSWPKKEERRAPAGTPPLTVRLLMAGAQVVPAEHTLDPNDPAAKATFYVTPIAKGWLRNERLEILVGGRKVQEMTLPAKVGSQGLTIALLVLAFLIPWFLLSYGKYSPLTLSKADVEKSEFFNLGAQSLTQFEKVMILNADDPGRKAKATYGKFNHLTPGEILTRRIEREVPAVPDVVNDSVPAVREGLVSFREKIGDLYDNIILWNEQYPLAFCFFVGFLVLALVSFIVHQDKQKKRSSKPIPIPRAGVDGLSPRHDEVVASEVG